MPRSISKHPNEARRLRDSLRIKMPPMTAKIASELKMMAAYAGWALR